MVEYYKQTDKENVPKPGEFRRRFSDDTILTHKDGGLNWAKTFKFKPWNKEGRRTDYKGEFPAFDFNQMNVNDFFEAVSSKSEESMYKGMLERIGRTVIWVDDLMDNPFLRFMKPPLEYGAAIEQAAFEEITSRPWIKNYQSGDMPNTTNPLFSTQLPRYLSEVATVNFSREIPLKMSEIEYKKGCQSANTIGDIAGALIAKINITFVDDMYQACKQYFCGSLRIAPEPFTDNQDTAKMPFTEDDFINNPMIDIIKYDESKHESLEDAIFDRLHLITDSQFMYKSRDYNPARRYVLTKKSTLILSKKWRYQLFLKKYAITYHPEHIKLGEEVDLLYIDDMPQMVKGFIKAPEDANYEYEYLGLIVDNRALGITPLNGGFSVETFHNPSEASTSYFGHYEMIFSFASLFNRKYLFLKRPKPNSASKKRGT